MPAIEDASLVRYIQTLELKDEAKSLEALASQVRSRGAARGFGGGC